jgi:hypothetical protein
LTGSDGNRVEDYFCVVYFRNEILFGVARTKPAGRNGNDSLIASCSRKDCADLVWVKLDIAFGFDASVKFNLHGLYFADRVCIRSHSASLSKSY